MEKNPFENIKNKGRKIAKNSLIAGGLALGVLSSSEAKSQTIDTPASIGRSIDSVAEVQYKKLLTHRDSVLEYNKQIEKAL